MSKTRLPEGPRKNRILHVTLTRAFQKVKEQRVGVCHEKVK
jgi:hypothetical protein